MLHVILFNGALADLVSQISARCAIWRKPFTVWTSSSQRLREERAGAPIIFTRCFRQGRSLIPKFVTKVRALIFIPVPQICGWRDYNIGAFWKYLCQKAFAKTYARELFLTEVNIVAHCDQSGQVWFKGLIKKSILIINVNKHISN